MLADYGRAGVGRAQGAAQENYLTVYSGRNKTPVGDP